MSSCGRCYTFNCSFGAATYAFLWFDDHLVCQRGAYVPKADSFDGSTGNPLRVLSKKQITVRLQAFVDPAHPYSLQPADRALAERRRAIEGNALQLRVAGREAPPAPACNGTWHEGDRFNGHDMEGDRKTKTKEACCAMCVADPSCVAVTWNAPGGMYGDSNCNLKYAAPAKPWKTSDKGEWSCQIRPNAPAPAPPTPPPPPPPPPPLPATLELRVGWQSGWGKGGPISPQVFEPVPSAVLSPSVVAEEAKRVSLQRNITNGWGTWANSVLDLVLMPEGARLTVGLCQLSSGKCITSTRPSDTGTMRVAEHAYDKSYVRMFLTFQVLQAPKHSRCCAFCF